MKKISVVGIGMGPSTLTKEGRDAILTAEVLMGAPRMLSFFTGLDKPVIEEYRPDRIADIVVKSDAGSYAVLVSGDTGFFSAAGSIEKSLNAVSCEVLFYPGISSVNCFFAKLKRPWQEAAFVSLHGRDANLADTVRRNALTFVLTGGNIPEIMTELRNTGFGELNVSAGENLDSENERILSAKVSELAHMEFGSLTVLLIENPDFDASVRTGIPDDRFIRGSVPMTKSEVRAVTLSKLRLKPDDVCADIGAGTGSVTCEMAISVYKGRVYAVEKDPEAWELINQNSKKFKVGNVIVIAGEAPEALEELPAVDAAFIGGSGGKMGEIFKTLLKKNPLTRIVVNAIAIESIKAALDAFSENGIEPEIISLGVSKGRPAGKIHLMMAQNPVTILSGGGRE